MPIFPKLTELVRCFHTPSFCGTIQARLQKSLIYFEAMFFHCGLFLFSSLRNVEFLRKLCFQWTLSIAKTTANLCPHSASTSVWLLSVAIHNSCGQGQATTTSTSFTIVMWQFSSDSSCARWFNSVPENVQSGFINTWKHTKRRSKVGHCCSCSLSDKTTFQDWSKAQQSGAASLRKRHHSVLHGPSLRFQARREFPFTRVCIWAFNKWIPTRSLKPV